MMYYIRLFLCLLGLILPWAGQVQAFEGGVEQIKAELIQEETTVQPGRPFWVALHLKIEDGWHVYWKNPGDAGMPLKIEWQLPEGFQSGPMEWPFPEKFKMEDIIGFGYHDEVVFLTQMIPPQNGQGEKEITAKVNWLVCSDENCQPGSQNLKLTIKVSSEAPKTDLKTVKIFEKARDKLPSSHEEVKTVLKEGIVQLQMPASEDHTQSVVEVAFFPEQQDVIDHSVDPVISTSMESKEGYYINLKGSDEVGVKPSKLKGVLVVHTKDKEKKNVQAFHIDSTIHDSSENSSIGFVDYDSVKSVFKKSPQGGLRYSKPVFEGGLVWALIFAFAGGMLLNLMPCVLPVISFKVMSFVKMAGQSRILTIKHSLLFCLGVILSFWILAGIMLALRAYGQAVGWGFQLQEPLFVVILATILFIFSLSLFGMFEWGTSVASWAGQTQVEASKKSSTGALSSFFGGVLATAVATPCTGPFLGSAVGFAVTLPIWQSFAIFTFLGLGMCFPYLLLALFPSFLRFMPKPGPWMEIFKQLMGFMLLATILWLMWVFSAQTNTISLLCVLAGFLLFAIGAWIYGMGTAPLVRKSRRIVAYVFVALFAILGTQTILFPRASWYSDDTLIAQSSQKGDWDGWETFSPERVAELQANGTPVLIDFTAKWCLICQANHIVLATDEVKQVLDEAGVVRMKADWTKSDPVITKALSEFGRNSVPLYVLYGRSGQEPVILPQVLTADVVKENVNLLKADREEIALK